MKVAEITTYKEGGVYTHVAELVKRMKVETIIISGNTKKEGLQKENGQTFFHIPSLLSIWEMYFINPIGSYKKATEIIKEQSVDIVHIHMPFFTFCSGIIRKKQYPMVLTTHYVLDFKGNRIGAFIYKSVIKWVTKNVGKKVDKIICVNKEYIHIYVSWGVERDKIVYIPNGIDTERFSPGKSDIKKKLKCNNLVVFWGRLGYQKNIQILVKAFKKIKTAGTKLVIIGKGPDMKKLEALAEGDRNVVFTGYLPDDKLLDYARGADVAVLPSRGESWGLVIGEAMACGLPVISPDVGKAKELLGGNRGIILENDTVEELAEKIDYLLNNKKIAKEMGQKSRGYIVGKYGWDEVAQKTENLYKEMLNQRKKPS